MVECTLSIRHCLRLNLQLHTCHISSFCTVAWQLARFQLTRRSDLFCVELDVKPQLDQSFLCCSDVNKIREGIGDKVASFLQWTSCCLCGVIMGLIYGWKLALIMVAISPLLIVAGGALTYVRTFRYLFQMLLLISTNFWPSVLNHLKNCELVLKLFWYSLFTTNGSTQ